MKKFMAYTMFTLLVASGCAEATSESETRELHIEPEGDSLRFVMVGEAEVRDFTAAIVPIDVDDVSQECVRDTVWVCNGRLRLCEDGRWEDVGDFQSWEDSCAMVEETQEVLDMIRRWCGFRPEITTGSAPGPEPEPDRYGSGESGLEGTWTREWTREEETQPNDDGHTDPGDSGGGSSNSTTPPSSGPSSSGVSSGNTQPSQGY